jgi:DNA-binding HxlR family transcriptional regulator
MVWFRAVEYLRTVLRRRSQMPRQKSFSCPTDLTVSILGGKWRVVILAYLKEGVRDPEAHARFVAEIRAIPPELP